MRTLSHLVRGALIGVAESIPGVSGGTIALVVGLYAMLIDSAGAVARGVAALVVDLPRGRGARRALAQLRSVPWGRLLPVLIGMALALLVAVRVIEPLIESEPVLTRALFFGLIAASIAVPARLVGRWSARHVAAAVVAAVLAALLTGLPAASNAQPSLWLVAPAAAVAICALVLPGVSGSFLLLTMGLYAPTLAAVNDLDVAYLAVFALGAVLGLGLFVSGLQWLLRHRAAMTLAVMSGLMLGSLRALWPWQTEERGLLAPGADLGAAILLAVVGAVVVIVLVLVERRFSRGTDSEISRAGTPEVD